MHRLGVEERVEHLVLDDDRLECPSARLGMVGGDGRHGLTDVPHDVGREHGLVLVDQPVVHLARHVVGRDHGLDAVDLPGRRRVDAHDPGVRMWRPQRGAPEHVVVAEVAGELERTLHLGDAVGPRGRRAQHAARGSAVRRRSMLMSPPPIGSPTTRCTASMMRPYPVHRQTLPDSSSRISISDGVGLPLEQVMCGEDQAGRAESALHGAGVDERGLDVGRARHRRAPRR